MLFTIIHSLFLIAASQLYRIRLILKGKLLTLKLKRYNVTQIV
jgi:hypothetical protein